MAGRWTCGLAAATWFAAVGLSAAAARAAGGLESDAPAEVAAAVEDGAPAARTRAASRVRHASRTLPPARPDELRTPEPPAAPSVLSLNPFAAARQAEPAPAPAPEPATSLFATLFGQPPAQPRGTQLPTLSSRADIDAMIARYAKLNGVPESLVHRIVIRESRYNPRAVGRGGAMGLMQIKTATARALGYEGGPAGLLDAETNLIYGVKYLAGAYRTADGDHDRAVSHYAGGYYYAAKRKGTLETAATEAPRSRRRGSRATEAAAAQAEPEPPAAPPSLFSFAASPGR